MLNMEELNVDAHDYNDPQRRLTGFQSLQELARTR